MKIYWAQGAMCAEPESPEERGALLVLWNSAIQGQGGDNVFRSGPGSTLPGGSGVHTADGIAVG